MRRPSAGTPSTPQAFEPPSLQASRPFKPPSPYISGSLPVIRSKASR